jgi:hypothetical protein
MPRRSRLLFFTGVACFFAAVGTMTDALSLEGSTPSRFLMTVLLTSAASALWAFFGTMRMKKSLIAMAFAQLAVLVVTTTVLPPTSRSLTVDQWRSQVLVHSVLTLFFILAGYLLFILFFRREGARFFSAHTEIKLASRIQERLVPTISKKVWRYEIFGLSRPSGVVGGDLLDFVEGSEMGCAYVADVAGHGVAAGVLMSMVKAAMRMHLRIKPNSGTDLLEAMNEVLCPLTEDSSYATFACVLISAEPRLTFYIAAHPPIFHFRRRLNTVEQRSIENFPVGMFARTRFESADIHVEPGDIVAIITDGVTEIFDDRGEELGYRHIEQALTESASKPLCEIVDQIVRRTSEFGRVTDDRTLLLLRYC